MSRAGSLVVVAGAQFAATDNELWVTGALPGVTGLASSATIITAVVPPGAGPGDLPVKKGGVSGNEGLSNAFPFAPAVAVSYCTAGVSASGCQATLSAASAPSASAASGFVLVATGVEGPKDGLFFFGANGRQASPGGNGTSFQCVAPACSSGTATRPTPRTRPPRLQRGLDRDLPLIPEGRGPRRWRPPLGESPGTGRPGASCGTPGRPSTLPPGPTPRAPC